MTRMFTLAAASLFALPVAGFAQQATDGTMAPSDQFMQQVEGVLTECDFQIDEDTVGNLTLSQATAILLAEDDNGAERCRQVEAALQ